MKKRLLVLTVLFACVFSSFADRFVKEVKPLSKGDFTYNASMYCDGEKQFFGLINIKSNGDVKYFCNVPVYSVKIKPFLEADAQWVMISSMKFIDDETIEIINEDNQVYYFDTKTLTVKSDSGKVDSNLINKLEKHEEKFFNEKIKTTLPIKVQPEKKKLSSLEEVVKAAESVLFEIYGEEKIKGEMPYFILKCKNKYYLSGSLPENYEGGVFEIIINADNSQVECITHGK